MKKFIIKATHYSYRYFLRRFLFLWSSETIHDALTTAGTCMGNSIIIREVTKKLFRIHDKRLTQTYHGITFENPVGLAAGFDYTGKLYNILPSLGFGFGTIGTITNYPYEGNPKPRLGRLIESQSLMVNKGFKNNGVKTLINQLSNKSFLYPVGLSIGQTNSPRFATVEAAIEDIRQAFEIAESSCVPFSYFELNISCPNLHTNVSFYSPHNLHALLHMVKRLKLSKPVFIKMPIEKTNEEIIEMLEIIMQYPIQGIIIGNLQKNRHDPDLVHNEVMRYQKGNFSGKPTAKRSNELIRLAYHQTKGKLTIIGCGGIFSAQDAYTKITLGASLVQFITGMIFEGPQLAAEINLGLIELLEQDGYKHISEAIGKEA